MTCHKVFGDKGLLSTTHLRWSGSWQPVSSSTGRKVEWAPVETPRLECIYMKTRLNFKNTFFPFTLRGTALQRTQTDKLKYQLMLTGKMNKLTGLRRSTGLWRVLQGCLYRVHPRSRRSVTVYCRLHLRVCVSRLDCLRSNLYCKCFTNGWLIWR